LIKFAKMLLLLLMMMMMKITLSMEMDMYMQTTIQWNINIAAEHTNTLKFISLFLVCVHCLYVSACCTLCIQYVIIGFHQTVNVHTPDSRYMTKLESI